MKCECPTPALSDGATEISMSNACRILHGQFVMRTRMPFQKMRASSLCVHAEIGKDREIHQRRINPGTGGNYSVCGEVKGCIFPISERARLDQIS